MDRPSLDRPSLDRPSLDRPRLDRPRLGRMEMAVLAAVVLFALGIVAVALWGGGAQAWAAVQRVPWRMLPVLLGLSLINYALRGARWLVFSRALHLGVPAAANLLYYVAGFAMTPTPGKAGEVVRLYLLRRFHGCAYDRSAALMIGDRLLDGLAATLVVAVTAPFFAHARSGAAAAAGLGAVMVALCLWPGVVRHATDAAFARLRRWPRLFVRARRAIRAMQRLARPRVFAVTLAAGAIGWTSEGIAFFLLLRALDPGAELGPAACVFMFVFAMLVGAVTFLPGGLGSTEATLVALLSLRGVPLPVAIVATGAIRITTLWFAVGLGMMALPAAVAGAGRVRPGARAPTPG